MRVHCHCHRYLVNPEHATYVKNGVPMCAAATCQKVQEHRAREQQLHRPPFVVFEEPFVPGAASTVGGEP